MMELKEEDLPESFKNLVIDRGAKDCTIRSNASSMEDIMKWVQEFGKNSNTGWVVVNSDPAGQRFACR